MNNLKLATRTNLFATKESGALLELSQKMFQHLNRRLTGFSDLNVLIIDDDNDDVMILEDLLQDAFKDKDLNVRSVNSYQEALKELRSGNYDVCFVDYLLGAETGLDLLERIQTEDLLTPVVFVTGQGDEHVAVNAIKKGAKEYLVKSELDSELVKQAVLEIYGFNSSPSTKKKVFLGSRLAHKSLIGPYSSYSFFMSLDNALKLNGG